MKPSLNLFTNKFVLTAIAFLVWMSFFDQHNWVSLAGKRRNLEEIKTGIAYLNAEIAQMEEACQGLREDPKYLERFARETYQMKREEEDLFIVK